MTKSEPSRAEKRDEALRLAEERFRSAFEEAPIGMALVAPDGRWLRVNRSLCEIVGYSEQELLQGSFQEITHPDDLEADLESVRQMLADEIRTYQMEKRYFHKDGDVVWIKLSVSLVRDSVGEPLHFISQIEDITARKHMQEELEDAARGFQLARDLLCTATFDGYLVSVNGVWAEVLGWSEEELRSRHFIEFVHPDDRARTLAAAATLERGGESGFFRHRWRRKDGSWCWLSWNSVGIVEEERAYGVARDITDRVEIEQALELQGEITANMAEGVCLVTMTEDPRIVYANPKFERILGYEPGELSGAPAIPVFQPGDRSPLEQEQIDTVAATLGEEGSAGSEARCVGKDGKGIWCRLSRSSFQHPDFGPVWVIVQQDITQQRRAREAWAEVERDKKRFLSSVSHELRTPLTSILGYTSLLLGDGDRLREEDREHVGVIERNAQRQLRLVEDLLSVAQAEAGDWRLQVGPIDLAEVVRGAAEELRPASEEKQQELAVNADEVTRMVGDADRLAQVVTNLVSNAIKFTPSAGRIDVLLGAEDDRALLRVRDTGPGVSPAARARLFDRLYRSDRAKRQQIPGAGLGLAIAKSIVEAHSGEIGVAASGPGGTTIEVSLPLRQAVPA